MIGALRFLAGILLLMVADLLIYYVALFLAVFARANIVGLFYRPVPEFIFSYGYLASMWWIPLLTISVIAFERLYTSRRPFWEETRWIIKAMSLSLLFVFFLISVRNIFGDISRLTFILLWIISVVLMPLGRYWVKRFLSFTGIWKENVLVIGTGAPAVEMARGLIQDRQLGYRIVGFLDDDEAKTGQELVIAGRTFQIFGKTRHFTKFVNMMGVTTVIIAQPGMERTELTRFAGHVQKFCRTVMIVPDLAGIAQVNTELNYLFAQKIFLLKINNNLNSRVNQLIKRLFDLAMSLLLLPFLLPVLGIIALLIRLDSKGGALIIQDRMGRNDRHFRCIKFRTMYENGDLMLEDYFQANPEARAEWQKFKKLRGEDPRVTRIGRILRKTSLDELPQIFNVLKGQMSLVGPRPYLPREREEMGEDLDMILLSTPGITGLWQISGRNDVSFDERLKLDTWYIQNWSLWLDMIILISTLDVVFRRKGAY